MTKSKKIQIGEPELIARPGETLQPAPGSPGPSPSEGPTTREIAKQQYDNMAALTRGGITPDELRTRNRKLREQVGDAAYEAAKGISVANHVRNFG